MLVVLMFAHDFFLDIPIISFYPLKESSSQLFQLPPGYTLLDRDRTSFTF